MQGLFEAIYAADGQSLSAAHYAALEELLSTVSLPVEAPAENCCTVGSYGMYDESVLCGCGTRFVCSSAILMDTGELMFKPGVRGPAAMLRRIPVLSAVQQDDAWRISISYRASQSVAPNGYLLFDNYAARLAARGARSALRRVTWYSKYFPCDASGDVRHGYLSDIVRPVCRAISSVFRGGASALTVAPGSMSAMTELIYAIATELQYDCDNNAVLYFPEQPGASQSIFPAVYISRDKNERRWTRSRAVVFTKNAAVEGAMLRVAQQRNGVRLDSDALRPYLAMLRSGRHRSPTFIFGRRIESRSVW